MFPSRPKPLPELDEGFLLSVVIPVYNEIGTLEEIFERVQNVEIPKEIVFVDDGSTDGSREVLEKFEGEDNVRVIFHEKNRGKGAALRTGFEACQGQVVVIQDADLEYDPRDFWKILRPYFEADADVVYGSRFLVDEYARVHLYFHYLGNRFLTNLSNITTGLNLTDMETCYKSFRREVLQGIEIESRGFTVEAELTAKVAKKQVKVFEVPINYAGRNYSEGKKITWKDGVATLWAILYFRFKR
ncbi:MAG: glycosyl transferase [Verrucomicrobiales bacterium]|nr:glycosyl transferase [Verrucomicrobiales bacterium]